MILNAAAIDRRDRSAVAVAEQNAALETDGRKHARQHLARLLVHEGYGARQLPGARFAVAGPRIDEHAGAGRRGELFGEIAPQADAAEAFMQHDDGRRRVGARADHAVFEPHAGKFEEAFVNQVDDRTYILTRHITHARRSGSMAQ